MFIKYEKPFGRIDYIEKKYKTIIIDYAHTPDGLKQVLENLLTHFNKKIILVFGCGGDRDKKDLSWEELQTNIVVKYS